MSKKTIPLSQALRTVTIAEAVQNLRDFDAAEHWIPEHARAELNTAIDAVMAACAAIHVTNVLAMLTDATAVLKQATGMASVTQYTKTAQADPLHRLRNILGAIGAAANLAFGGDLAAVQQILPALKARTPQASRPLTDDEVLLCRIDMWAYLRGSNAVASVTRYVICESGGLPGESTTLSLDFVIDDGDSISFLASGNRLRSDRILDVADFGRPIFGRCIDDRRAVLARSKCDTPADRAKPLTYGGKQAPGAQTATASAQRMIDHLLERWNLKQADITAYSLSLWAANNAYKAHGLDAAAKITGCDRERTIKLLNRPPDRPVITPTITSFL